VRDGGLETDYDDERRDGMIFMTMIIFNDDTCDEK
jgi:hypothetical protein